MKRLSDEEDMLPLGVSSDEDESDKASDSDISLNKFDEDVSSDSDSAPESFSFSATHEKLKQAEKLTAQSVKQQKEELKRKRKQVLLQNIKQREEKRKRIESKRLPDHILENLDEEFDKGTYEDESKGQEEISGKEKCIEEEIMKTAGNITFKCKVLPIEAQKPKYVPEQVAHFKDRMLYGCRIKREKSNRTAVLKRQKQHIRR